VTNEELLRRYQAGGGRLAAANAEGAAVAPSLHTAVVTCMDSRIDVFALFGLAMGEVHVLRNAGGVVTDDTIRSLAISQNLQGTEEIILVHHTDCGMLAFTDEEFAAKLEEETGERPDWAAQTFTDLDQEVRDSIARLKESTFVPKKDSIRGFVYDVKTGDLREVT
jgi:carbonic anhydrase